MTNSLLINTDANGITTLTLNRPEVHNAFDDQLIEQLATALQQADENPNTRIVVLKANGKNFSAGADLRWMQRMADASEAENIADAKKLALLMQTLYSLSKPTIAIIQGAVMGGGVGLVACCDIAIAADNASFCLSEVKLGLSPSVISPYILKAMGERATRRYFLTAERFNTVEALRIGLLHQVVAASELDDATAIITNSILQAGPNAVRAAKKLIQDVVDATIDDKLIDATARHIATLRVGAEAQERMREFLSKRN